MWSLEQRDQRSKAIPSTVFQNAMRFIAMGKVWSVEVEEVGRGGNVVHVSCFLVELPIILLRLTSNGDGTLANSGGNAGEFFATHLPSFSSSSSCDHRKRRLGPLPSSSLVYFLVKSAKASVPSLQGVFSEESEKRETTGRRQMGVMSRVRLSR